jgi:hypothetical protein
VSSSLNSRQFPHLAGDDEFEAGIQSRLPTGDEASGHEWLDRRTAGSKWDAEVAQDTEHRLLGQVGETERIKHVDLAAEGARETPIPAGRVSHLFRGMSEHEFQQARERGHIQSDQRGVLDQGWEGTNAGTDFATAHSYMPRQGSGRIVKIAHHPEDGWFASHVDSYARTRSPVPWSRVVAHTEPFTHPLSTDAPISARERVRKSEQ